MIVKREIGLSRVFEMAKAMIFAISGSDIPKYPFPT